MMDRDQQQQIQATFRRIEQLTIQVQRHARAIQALWMGDARTTTYGVDHGTGECRLAIHPGVGLEAEIGLLKESLVAYEDDVRQLTERLAELVQVKGEGA